MKVQIVLFDGFDELDAIAPFEILQTAAAAGASASTGLAVSAAAVTGTCISECVTRGLNPAASDPPSRINEASVRRYPLIVHCSPSTPAPNSLYLGSGGSQTRSALTVGLGVRF